MSLNKTCGDILRLLLLLPLDLVCEACVTAVVDLVTVGVLSLFSTVNKISRRTGGMEE